MRFIQYNGAFSCSNCMQHGGRFGLGNTTIQVFPYEKNIGLRDNNETVEFASQAIAARQHDPDATVYGVKGPSLLSSLLPNMILCMGIDIMHGVFLGVMKTLNSLWFDGVNSEYPFSISNMVHLVDAKLKSIKPPHSFQNMPCRIKKDKWKAFDLKAFFFYYSLVVLNGIIPDRYWFHHVRLVTAISILCQEGISPEDFYFCVVTLYDRLIWELHDAPLENVLPHLNKVSPQNGFHVFPVESIRSMCIYMSFDDKEYISLPVNNLEVE
ncbi:TATA-box-binding protein [Frankliniella fusca]|uniref:TATA-box-binding protein n=1 Tax=Frankliniella fusca TaxID=407009 RepID=A0AAE1LEF0_9NEOP|nr:TATA-box-binding protein [Frankliniella fusca]